MMIPTLHLNGTSRTELIKQLTDAGHALALAIDALGNASPHGRDYYPQGPDAFRHRGAAPRPLLVLPSRLRDRAQPRALHDPVPGLRAAVMRKPPEECTEPEVCSANQCCEHDCTYKRIMRLARGTIKPIPRAGGSGAFPSHRGLDS